MGCNIPILGASTAREDVQAYIEYIKQALDEEIERVSDEQHGYPDRSELDTAILISRVLCEMGRPAEVKVHICSLTVQAYPYPHAFFQKLCSLYLSDEAPFSISSDLDFDVLKTEAEKELEDRARTDFMRYPQSHQSVINLNQKKFSWIWTIEDTKTHQEAVFEMYADTIGRVCSTISVDHLNAATPNAQKALRSAARL